MRQAALYSLYKIAFNVMFIDRIEVNIFTIMTYTA